MEINPYAHSAWTLKMGDTVVQQKLDGQMCYSSITYNDGLKADFLKIYFGQIKIDMADGAEEWCDWVINRSIVKDAFITKDAKEGLDNGFEIDTSCERLMMQSGMIMLRIMFENDSWSWFYFKELGYNEFDSLVLASNCVVDIDNKLLMTGYHNPNHLVIQPNNSYETYEGKFYSPTDTPTLSEGFDGIISINCGWGNKNTYYYPNINEITKNNLEFNKKNCDKILQYLKGL